MLYQIDNDVGNKTGGGEADLRPALRRPPVQFKLESLLWLHLKELLLRSGQ